MMDEESLALWLDDTYCILSLSDQQLTVNKSNTVLLFGTEHIHSACH